jgi:(p)ppGpp synthase/HD superfamily hydrolase
VVRSAIKRLLLADQTMSVNEIQAALLHDGLRVSRLTISSIRSEFRHTIRVLQEEGLMDQLKPKPKKKPRPPIVETCQFERMTDLSIKIRKKRFKPWRFSG